MYPIKAINTFIYGEKSGVGIGPKPKPPASHEGFAFDLDDPPPHVLVPVKITITVHASDNSPLRGRLHTSYCKKAEITEC